MQNEVDLSAHRQEIIANDRFHKTAAMILGLIIVGLGVSMGFTDNIGIRLTIPLLTVSLVGIILRLETTVHRQGGFVQEYGDPWEEYRHKLIYDKVILSLSDLLVFIPVLVVLGISLMETAETHPTYTFIVSIVILIEIGFWPVVPMLVKIKKS